MAIFQHSASAAILKESIKLISKNGWFMALIALISSILYSSLFLFFIFSCNSLVSDLLFQQYSMLNPSAAAAAAAATTAAVVVNPFEGIMKDAKLLILVDLSFIVGIYIVSFCTSVATVILAADSYNNFSSGKKEWSTSYIKRALITSLYTTLLSTGYFVIVSIAVTPLLMFSLTAGGYTLLTWVGVVTAVVATIIYLYLSVEWILALVVSLTEENNYGIQGLGRAGVLMSVEGKKVQGFILNLVFCVVSWVLLWGFIIIFGEKKGTGFWVYASMLSCLMKILQLVSYTVLYFQCKNERGEEIVELQGSVGYQKLSLATPV